MNGLKKLLLPVLAGALALALTIPAVAQDSTATPDASGSTGSTDTTAAQGTGMLSCDSSTILLAGLAQRYFGYMPTDVTLGNYAYGQYSPLFDVSTMSSGSSTGMMGEATADASGSTTGDTSGAATNPTLAPSTVMLSPAVISGEDPSCTQLRTSLESFFSTQMQSPDWDTNFRNGMSGMSSTGASG